MSELMKLAINKVALCKDGLEITQKKINLT